MANDQGGRDRAVSRSVFALPNAELSSTGATYDTLPMTCLGWYAGRPGEGIQDAMVVDVGGTSTDIGQLRHGFPQRGKPKRADQQRQPKFRAA